MLGGDFYIQFLAQDLPGKSDIQEIQEVLVTEPVLKIIYNIITCVLSCSVTLLLSAVNDIVCPSVYFTPYLKMTRVC